MGAVRRFSSLRFGVALLAVLVVGFLSAIPAFAGRVANGCVIVVNPTREHHTSCRDANLAGRDFSHANLDYADLDHAKLADANFSYARLVDANMAGADMIRAILANGQLHGARLTDANLSGAELYRADMEDAHLDIANVAYANMYHATLYLADIYGIKHLFFAVLCGTTMPSGKVSDRDC